MTQKTPPHRRYELLQSLGAGGMGAVFRAVDRLTGETVALKQVVANPMQPTTLEFRLALAHEFQALAALRHPHVVAVRDYGFEAEQPYFTMELLPQARSFVAAAQFLSLSQKIDQLLSLLTALVYIHRQGIIHRDLKPGNVLVTQNVVKLLDFGLATMGEHAMPSAGTLAYMAPELLREQRATVASDLYAVGVMAYELLAGWHPFAQTQNMVQAILQSPPDMTYLEAPQPLKAVLSRLLAKEPNRRYSDASTTIAALCEAVARPLPVETAATRESFLQAAPFIGRQSEMNQLLAALEQARAGTGTAWLVEGESGIGKSRLLQELRTQALVQGMIVVRGQIPQEGSSAYQVWAELLRPLLLLVSLDDLEAAVLHPIIPDLPRLLEHPIPAAPALEAKAAQTRLLLTIVDLLQRAAQQQPLLLLLEDLHWVDESSLGAVQHLMQNITTQSLCLIASYRPGERTELKSQLTAMQHLRLTRLAAHHVADLSAAMLGPGGREPALVHFLQRETEGNTFFIVEAMRALAEETGRLDQIAAATLPSTIFAGGIKQVIQRRLARVPMTDQPLLQLAAVAGRQLDEHLLAYLAPEVDIAMWLTRCANTTVLERPDGTLTWQFSHDKLREGLLLQLSAEQRQPLHQQIGTALETVYADDLTPHYADLVNHFTQAGLITKQRIYLRLAAQQAEKRYANEVAIGYYQQLLPLLDAAAPGPIHLALGAIYRRIGQWDAAATHLQAAWNTPGSDLLHQAQTAHAFGTLERGRNHYAAALTWLKQANILYTQLQQSRGACETWVELANVAYQQGAYDLAQEHLAEAMQVAQDEASLALVQHNRGSIAYSQGDYETAQAQFQAALTLRRALDDRAELANSYNNLGLLAYRQGDFTGAEEILTQSLILRREIGDRWGVSASLSNLGMIPYQQKRYDEARHYWEEALHIRRALGEKWGLAGLLDNLALVAASQQHNAEARQLVAESVTMRRELGDKQGLAITLSNRARLAVLDEDWSAAAADYRESLLLAQEIGDQIGCVFALTGVATVWAETGQHTLAAQLLAAATQHLAQMGGVWESDEQMLYDQALAQVQAGIPVAAYEAAWQIGCALTPAAAAALAMETHHDILSG